MLKDSKVKIMHNEGHSQEDFDKLMSLYDSTMKTVSQGSIVKGKIAHITQNDVVLDIGFKSEGVVSIDEFQNLPDMKVGDEVDVYFETMEDKNGRLVLSYKRAEFMRTWEKVIKSHESGEIVKGRCTRRIKGGLVVDLFGIEAFLPGSQIDVRPVRDFDIYINKEMEFRVVKINHPSENVVVSHKVLVEEELADQRKEILTQLEKGQVLEGIVKAITDFGVFVDLGGVDGLIHITDLSWGRINHPSEILKLDQKITVVITDYEPEKKRISLGFKQLQKHPWENILEKYAIGSRISGKVVSMTEYGAFIEIEKGVEGLIHISEMSWTQHVKHPSQMVSMGQIIEAQILSIDFENKKISLGIRQLLPDPWTSILQIFPIDSRHKGVVRNLTNFGVFVELDGGIDGLIHISDLSWTKKIKHPGEVLKKGQTIDVQILGLDVDQRRISLGFKQLNENPWEKFGDSFKVGTEVEGKIVRLLDKGVIVELPFGVEGFVPTSQLSLTSVKNLSDSFKENDLLTLVVIEFASSERKCVLSAVEYLRGKEQQVVDEYVEKHKLAPITLKDIVPMPPTDEERKAAEEESNS
mgnify:CR=1 FL=1